MEAICSLVSLVWLVAGGRDSGADPTETLVKDPKEEAGDEARGLKSDTKHTNSAATEEGPETLT